MTERRRSTRGPGPFTLPQKRTRVVWNDAEKAAIVAAGRAIRQADPTRGDLATLRKAMRDALPEDRHRALTGVHPDSMRWFLDGLAAPHPPALPSPPPPPSPRPAPDPDPVDLDTGFAPGPIYAHLSDVPGEPLYAGLAAGPPGPEPTPPPAVVATAGPEQVAVAAIEQTVALNRAVLGALRTMMRDIRDASELMAELARDSSAARRALTELARDHHATRGVLTRVVDSLDPALLAEPAAASPAPPSLPPPSPAPRAEPPPPPLVLPPGPRPKVAIVAPHMSQVKKIKEALDSVCELRIFESGRDAVNKRFANSEYVVLSSMASRDVAAHARSVAGDPARVVVMDRSGADVLIAAALEFVKQSVAERAARNGAFAPTP